MPSLEDYLNLNKEKIEIAIQQAVLEEQKSRFIAEAAGILVNYGIDINAIKNAKKDEITKSDLKQLKNIICDMLPTDENKESAAEQVQAIEIPDLDLNGMPDKVIKFDQEHWLMIDNGKTYLYKTSSIGAGDNGSVHRMLDIETGEKRVGKLQYGRMDITEFVRDKDGERFEDKNQDINGDVFVANGQRYVITPDNTPYILVVENGVEHVDPSGSIFLEEIDGRYFNFEFISQTADVVAKENQTSKNYKPGGVPFGVDKGQVDEASREFLEHVIPIPKKSVEDYEIKAYARKLLIDKEVTTPVFVLIQNYVEGKSLDELIDPKDKSLIIKEGTAESKAHTAIDFVLKLIKSTEFLHSSTKGGYYHSSDPDVVGIRHRDIRPGNIKVTANGEIKYLDLAAAIEYKQDGVAKAKMGKTEGYTDPAILAKIAVNLGREVDWEFTEKK